jgi:predicted nucleic acid-binding Zn finger protein
MTKQILEKFNARSNTSSRIYIVSKYDDGSYACSCPSWIFKKGERKNCKHIQEIINKQEQTEISLTIQDLKNEDIRNIILNEVDEGLEAIKKHENCTDLED